jgi:hypothetical protein
VYDVAKRPQTHEKNTVHCDQATNHRHVVVALVARTHLFGTIS